MNILIKLTCLVGLTLAPLLSKQHTGVKAEVAPVIHTQEIKIVKQMVDGVEKTDTVYISK